ncbi:MAG: bifunctional 3-deoxy-7-phosphoheptulonate synthase/chorismate mutase type II [Bacteroidota bacterium]
MIKITKIEDWGLGLQKKLVIAGPCSAETPEQIEKIVSGMKSGYKPDVFRAGIWKPRTRPGTFEGVGADGLQWMEIVREALEIPVTVEVANAKHVEEALKANIDILWIGARTTVNPFSVQEICDALKGVDIPVMVKNPINPDLALWKGALERLNTAGITKLAAIHRGFSSIVKTKYRNNPEWDYALRLKEEIPHLPIICDPSHIAGTRDLIAPVSQKAYNLGLDGLMIETHHTPDEAWSDAKQQVTPESLAEIISNLEIRDSVKNHPELKNMLDQLREQVDVIDLQLLDLLQQRFEHIESIGEYKAKNNLTVFQRDRWQKVTNDRIKMGLSKNMSEEFMKDFLDAIHAESLRKQEAKIKEQKSSSVKA